MNICVKLTTTAAAAKSPKSEGRNNVASAMKTIGVAVRERTSMSEVHFNDLAALSVTERNSGFKPMYQTLGGANIVEPKIEAEF